MRSRFADSYRDGEHGQFIVRTDTVGTVGANVLLVEQPAGTYVTAGTNDLVLATVSGFGVAAEIDFGAGRFSYDSRETPFFLSPPRSPSVFTVENAHIARLLAIPMDEVRELLGRQGVRAQEELAPLFSGGFEDPFLQQAVDQLWQTLSFEGRTGALLQDSVLITILLALQRRSGATRTAEMRISGGLSPHMVRKATEFLADGLQEPQGLKALADHMGMSEFHLQRAFTATVGCSPHRWQFLRRMELARELLRRPGMSILDVALSTGYDSLQGFSRMFRREHGCSPAQFRRSVL